MVAFNPLADIRTWLLTHSVLAPLHGGRVWFRIPDGNVGYPFIRFYRAGGGYQPGTEIPLQDLRVGIDVWGAAPGAAAGGFADTAALTTAVETALHNLTPGLLVGQTVLYNAEPSGAPFTPDVDTGEPRFTVTATVTCGPAPTT